MLPLLRTSIRPLALLAVTSLAPSALSAQRSDSFPLRWGMPQVVGREVALGSTIGAVLGSTGTVHVIDHVNTRVVAFSPEGRLLWTFGRKGRGPGEFQLPYRIGLQSDGNLIVYDARTGEVTRLAQDGRFLERWSLPIRFHQVDRLMGLETDEILIAGTAERNGRDLPHAVHRFSISEGQLEYRGSFGALPPARDPRARQSWGAGAITQSSARELFFVRRIPYEVYRFASDGRQLSVIRPPFRTRGTPDDEFRIERIGQSTSFSAGSADVERPGSAHLVGSVMLVTRFLKSTTWWDAFSPSGSYLGSRRLPEGWGELIGYDASRRVLWSTALHHEEPVLLRIPLESGR